MTWIKLCGMTNREDVELAAAVGADAVGFVVAPESKRRISVPEAAAIGTGIDIARFLVSVDLAPNELIESAVAAGVTGVQPHGLHSVAAAHAAAAEGFEVLFPKGVAPGSATIDVSEIPDFATPLLDAKIDQRHGGTGVSFDWSLAAGISRAFVVAGGLKPETVTEALRVTGAWGVDVVSGIEASPGRKDPAKVRAFMEAVR